VEITPAAPDGGGLGDMGAAGGLLAGLTGGSATAQVPRFIQFLYALSSVEVARSLDNKYDLLCRIYKGECDLKTRQWKPRTSMQDRFTSLQFRLSGLPDPNVGPRDIIDLAKYIGGSVGVAQLKKTDSVNTITYMDRNPKFAAQFLTRPADGLPPVPAALLTLMGVSASAYTANKIVNTKGTAPQ